jgi:hypothetical protein
MLRNWEGENFLKLCLSILERDLLVVVWKL